MVLRALRSVFYGVMAPNIKVDYPGMSKNNGHWRNITDVYSVTYTKAMDILDVPMGDDPDELRNLSIVHSSFTSKERMPYYELMNKQGLTGLGAEGLIGLKDVGLISGDTPLTAIERKDQIVIVKGEAGEIKKALEKAADRIREYDQQHPEYKRKFSVFQNPAPQQ